MTARQFRAAGEHFWLKYYGLEAAAARGGNTPETVLKHYANGTAVDQRAEWTPVLQQMASRAKDLAKEAVLGASEGLPAGVSTAIGLCAKQNSPEPMMDAPPVTPNCKSSQGCLFCKRYRVHANAVDMKKLMSARYCISETSKNTLSTELAAAIFGGVILRIDTLLGELKSHDVAAFLRVKSDVEEKQNLDPFWADKLLQLYELGLI
jgi:hypothetical protein